MGIDVTIEIISNGYIVTCNDSSANKNYFSSLDEFVKTRIIEELRERETEIAGGFNTEGPFYFNLKTDL